MGPRGRPRTDDARLEAAFTAVRRRDFLPADQVGFAGEDTALRIGHGQTNSQPSTVRAMLSLLDVAPGHRVLDVGCGSGWTTALLGHLVGADGEVVGVEIVPELVTWGRANLSAYAMGWTRIEAASPDRLGWPAGAPYDRVLVSAEASRVPTALVDQLADDGVLVVPVRGRMTVVERSEDGPRVREEGWYSFVPLIEPEAR
jgi:protein-L-isoaspartate(D-aspartate) O-methyltransferase